MVWITILNDFLGFRKHHFLLISFQYAMVFILHRLLY